MNNNENTVCQNLFDVTKKMPRGKFIAWNAYIREKKKPNKFLAYEARKRRGVKLEVNRKRNKTKIKLIK